jgi:hypothetical protein
VDRIYFALFSFFDEWNLNLDDIGDDVFCEAEALWGQILKE